MTKRIATIFCLTLIAALTVGCETATVDKSLTETYPGSDLDAQMEFWHELNNQRLTSNDDAFHGVLLFLDGEDDAADYDGRVATLKQRGLLSDKFNRPANEAVTRGTLATVLVKALDIKGGVMMRLVGPTERYAVRELTYVNVYPRSSPQQVFAGDEFMAIIGKAEDYQRRVKVETNAKQLDAAQGDTPEASAAPDTEAAEEAPTEESAE